VRPGRRHADRHRRHRTLEAVIAHSNAWPHKEVDQ
jgi:hypothetical protein